ncbi:TetR/AcrR family transcriptional regulator [Companilactobacillus keshanensis]|uniref:TetR/AcrR family transcriptional regulator n=1 Tax=Companilactobacillus keshanensis TaxID=2486003 RepID=A0ABW4BR73_9LACO|nr:TetR-like C-terminal domain-containing protein [Companilactobacillus keshanensis]
MDTKEILAQTLKNLMIKIPVDKITINILTNEAKVARNTFYYHFDDIKSILEWIYAREIVVQLAAYQRQSNWTDGFKTLLGYIYDNRKFCLNTFRSTNRSFLEHFLYRLAFDMVSGVVMDLEPDCDANLRDEISNFYGRALTSQVIQWLVTDMKESEYEFVERMDRMLGGTIEAVVKRNYQSLDK